MPLALRPFGLAALLAFAPPAFAQETPAVPPSVSPAEVPPASPAPVEAPQEAAPSASAADAAPAEAEDEAAEMLRALSPLVADVQVLGPWMEDERRGIWRTVMLQATGETEGNRFFVQQIEDVDGEVVVSTSTEITEIGDLNGAVVSYRMDEPTKEQPELLTLFLDIVPLDAEIAETYELFFTTGEPYVFGPASN